MAACGCVSRQTQPLIAAFETLMIFCATIVLRIDMWTTTYVHVFDGPDGIADWFAGSALQPFLERLSDDERCAFLARYRDGLRDAYPVQSDGKSPARPIRACSSSRSQQLIVGGVRRRAGRRSA